MGFREVVFFFNILGQVKEFPLSLFCLVSFPVFHADRFLTEILPIKGVVSFLWGLSLESGNERDSISFRALCAGELG